MGAWSYWHHRIRQQREAIVEIETLQKQLTKSNSGFIRNGLTRSYNPTPWWLRLSGEKSIPVTTGVSFDLRSAGNNHLERSGITDGDLQMLRVFPHLYVVRVPRSDVGDDGLGWVKPLRRLKHLDLSHSKVTDEDLSAVAGLPDLESLDLSGLKITAAGFEHLASCPKLRNLTLEGLELSDSEVNALGRMPALENLTIRLSPSQRLHLQGLERLKQLSILSRTEQLVLKLEALPLLLELDLVVPAPGNLKSLEIDSAELRKLKMFVASPKGIARQSGVPLNLSAARGLQDVEIHGWDDAWAESLAACPSIARLKVYSTSPAVGDDALRGLARSPQLVELELGPCDVSDAGLAALATCPSLESLMIESRGVTEAGIAHLGELPALKSLMLRQARCNGDVGSAFTRFPALELLEFRNCRFAELTLSGGSDNAALPALAYVSLHHCRAQKLHVSHLASLRNLQIEERNPRAIEVEHLGSLERLRITLGERQQVERLVLRDLPQLQTLFLTCNSPGGAKIPADTFEHLSQFRNLRDGKVYHLRMPPEAEDALIDFEESRGVRLR
jgi:Leucine-rich repeat (LRR) protein